MFSDAALMINIVFLYLVSNRDLIGPKPKEVQEQIWPSSPSRQSASPTMGPKSAQQMQRGRPVQKR